MEGKRELSDREQNLAHQQGRRSSILQTGVQILGSFLPGPYAANGHCAKVSPLVGNPLPEALVPLTKGKKRASPFVSKSHMQ